MKDTDTIPWGTHKGTPIGELPFDYLLKLYRKGWLGGEVLAYFERQLKVIETCEAEAGISATGQPPKKYLIDNYECSYPNKKVKDGRNNI